ncbi:MAG: hypothetical protein AAFO94_19790, partial [Bacteroidota bacterium]
MKNIIFVTLLLLFGVSLQAQSQQKAKVVTAAWTQRYQLSETQQEQLLIIQQRKIRNLKEIRSLQKNNPNKYLQRSDLLQISD